MITTIRINKDLQQQLKIKSAETGISQLDLANKYILNELKSDKNNENPPMSLEEIEKLLTNDLPESDLISEKLTGLIDNPSKTDSVKLKKTRVKRKPYNDIFKFQLFNCNIT